MRIDKKAHFKAAQIALIVGTILNIINQGEVIVAMDFEAVNYLKMLLTYLTPYAVSVYTANSLKFAGTSV